MSTNAISSSVTSALVQQLSTSSSSKTSGSQAQTTATDADSMKFSKMGAAMKQLKELETSDPTKFKKVTAQISSKLTELAKNQTGETAQMTSDLASKFASASESGSMDALKPSGPPPAGAPPRGAGAYANHATSTDAMESARTQLDNILSSALGGSS